MTISQAKTFIGCHVVADGESAKVIGVDTGGDRERRSGVWLCLSQPRRPIRWYDASRDRETSRT